MKRAVWFRFVWAIVEYRPTTLWAGRPESFAFDAVHSRPPPSYPNGHSEILVASQTAPCSHSDACSHFSLSSVIRQPPVDVRSRGNDNHHISHTTHRTAFRTPDNSALQRRARPSRNKRSRLRWNREAFHMQNTEPYHHSFVGPLWLTGYRNGLPYPVRVLWNPPAGITVLPRLTWRTAPYSVPPDTLWPEVRPSDH